MASIKLGTAQPLADLNQQVRRFLEQYLPLEWVTPPQHAYARNYPGAFPPSNHTPMLALQPNQAYWPTGPTRWGYGYLLMTGLEKDKLSTNAKASLEIATPIWTLTTDVYPLTPRQVLTSNEQNGGLWIVPFVDERYWWQFESLNIQPWTATDWEGLLTQIEAALNVTFVITKPISADYLIPSPLFWRQPLNAAVALDAVCQSLGLRLARGWDGSLKLQTPAEAAADYTNNAETLDQSHQLTGVSPQFGVRPGFVYLACRVAVNGMVCENKRQHYAFYTTVGPNRRVDTNFIIHSTAVANWSDPGAADPANKLALDKLAAALGASFEEWRDRIYDFGYSGIKQWEPCGFDDFLLHSYGVESLDYEVHHPDTQETAKIRKVYEPQVQTRIASYQDNYLQVRSYSTDSNAYIPGGNQSLCRLDSDLLPGASATGTIVEWTGTVWIERGSVTVQDYAPALGGANHGAVCALAGETIWVEVHRPSATATADAPSTCHPVAADGYGLARFAIATATIEPGATGAAAIVRKAGEAGPAIQVVNVSSDTINQGGLFPVIWTQYDSHWQGAPGGGGGQPGEKSPRFIQFTLADTLNLTDTQSPGAIVTNHWNGTSPGPTVTVQNTCNNFYGPGGTCGVARENIEDGLWQIIVLWDKQARFIEFTANQDFNRATGTISATLVAYWDGADPTPVTGVVNTGGMFSGYSGQTGVARLNFATGQYQAVFFTHNHPLRWVEFDTSSAFDYNDAGPHAMNVTSFWNGKNPGPVVNAMNTGGIFRSNGAGYPGVAAEQEDGTWQIVQLKCEAPASHAISTTDPPDTIPGYDNAPLVPIPFTQFEHSSGDLLTINAQGEVEFLRDTRGALRVTIGATWENQLGPSASDQSVLTFQVNTGAGWVDEGAAALVFTHVYLRIPPNNYILGGSTERSYWTRQHFNATDRFRVVAHSTLDTFITSLVDLSVEVLETYDDPLPPP